MFNFFRATKLLPLLLAVFMVSRSVLAAVPEQNLPDLGDQSAVLLSAQEERRLGEDFMREARARLDLLDDPELNEYLQRLGQRLTESIQAQPAFYFFLVQNPTINAFAVPGGFIGVHTGLLLAARNEAELAAVLAHETAHITQRHIPRLIAESQRISGPALAALLAGILIAASGAQGGEAAIALTTAGLAQHQINFTRAFEEEADRIGMKFLNAAGYDARAMPAFFEHMESLSRIYENNLPEFLRTHPVTGRRIAESRNHAENFSIQRNPADTDFRHMQARLRTLSSKPEEAVKYFRDKIQQQPRAEKESSNSTDRYGLALALMAARHYPEALKESQALLRSNPDQPVYHSLRAEAELAVGNTVAGLDIFSRALQRFPQSISLTRRYASALLKTGRASQARDVLDTAVRLYPDEPSLQKMLASAAGASGRTMEAHRAFGEYYYLVGQPRAAVEQFELAIQHANKNFYYVSSLEARIRQIREKSGLLFKKETAPPRSPAPPPLRLVN